MNFRNPPSTGVICGRSWGWGIYLLIGAVIPYGVQFVHDGRSARFDGWFAKWDLIPFVVVTVLAALSARGMPRLAIGLPSAVVVALLTLGGLSLDVPVGVRLLFGWGVVWAAAAASILILLRGAPGTRSAGVVGAAAFVAMDSVRFAAREYEIVTQKLPSFSMFPVAVVMGSYLRVMLVPIAFALGAALYGAGIRLGGAFRRQVGSPHD